MRLPLEAYQLIVHYTENRTVLCTLARTSHTFQRAAERALYSTLTMNSDTVFQIGHALSSNPRLGQLVETLTISTSPSLTSDDASDASSSSGQVPDGYWDAVADALSRATRLRHLNIHVDGDASHSRILRHSSFKLESFHCDLTWDADLVSFLNTQEDLVDLYIADYALRPPMDPDSMDTDTDTPSISSNALPSLSVLESSFIDAVAALAPGRPLMRVKTCFSREDTEGKEEELQRLSAALQQTARRVMSLDLADASYSEDFTLTVLDELARRLPGLRYFGTLVLPVGLEVRSASYPIFLFLPLLSSLQYSSASSLN